MSAAARLRDRYGPCAVVTGASDGIGRAFAQHLAEAGLDLVLVARRRVMLEELAASLTRAHGIVAHVVDADLGQPAGVDAVLDATRDLPVGLLVAAAGFGTSGPLAEARIADELAMVDVNCRAVLALCHGYGGRMARQRRGGIVLMSSLLAFQGVPRAAGYAATKAFVQTLAEGLRVELAPSGVDVVAAAPGPVRSGFAARANMRMGMAGTPDVVARATLAALGRRGTVRPGWLAKALEASLVFLPRVARARILARVMTGMTKHQHGAGQLESARSA